MRRAIPLVLALSPLAARAEVPADVAAAPGAAALPAADGLWVRRHLTITVDAQGRVTREVEQALKPFTDHPMRHDLLDPRLDWDDARTSLEVLEAVTWMADGTEVRALPNSLVPNTAPELEWAVPYAAMRQLVVAHVGVEHGATSLLRYRVADRAATGQPLWGMEPLADAMPIRDLVVRFDLPSGTKLLTGVINGSGTEALQFSERDDRERQTWQVRAVGVAGLNVAENGGAPLGVAQLVWSTARDWRHLRSFLESQVGPSIVADAAVQAKVGEVLEDSLEPEERLARIHAFVVEGVRTVAWPIHAFGYATRGAPQVLDSSVGHALDKAVLEVAMLRNAGFVAHVALVRSAPGALPDVPAPVLLDQPWVRAVLDGQAVWLDPTRGLDAANLCAIDGRQALVLDGKAEAPAAVTGCGEHRTSLRVRLDLGVGEDELTASGTADIDLLGRFNPIVAYDRGSNRLAGLGSGLAGFFGEGQREVAPAVHTAARTSARATFKDGALAVPASGLVRLDLPRAPGAVTAAGVQAWRGKRTLPFAVPAPGREEVLVEIALPEGWEVAALPAPAEIANAAGSFRRTVAEKDGVLTVRANLTLTQEVVPPQAWSDLRALVLAADAPAGRAVLLRKAAEGE